MDPNWIVEDKLASFNDDTFRAELGPRRCIRDQKTGQVRVVTPEEAAAAEREFLDATKKAKAKHRRAVLKARRENKPRPLPSMPRKDQFVFIDLHGEHFPKVWKLYELQETGEYEMVRVDEDGNELPLLDDKGQPNKAGELVEKLDEDGNPIPVKRFYRVGQVDSFDEVASHVPGGA